MSKGDTLKAHKEMLDDYGFEIYEENTFPLAYLITFRTYGTWLHGNQRSSVQRSRDKRFKSIRIDPNVPLEEKMLEEMKQPAFILTESQRDHVRIAIEKVCAYRRYSLHALNVRTNHGHTVVSKAVKPEKIVNDFKVYATRRLREHNEVSSTAKVWSRGASTRYLWKPRHVEAAVDYVLYSQGDVPFGTVFTLE